MNYLLALSRCFPEAEAYVLSDGDPTVYDDLIWITPPISQADLETCVDATIESEPDTVIAQFASASDGDILSYDATNGLWKSKPATGIRRIIYGNIASSSGTSRINLDGTVPTITDGTEIGSVTLTPNSTNSKFLISFTITAQTTRNNSTLTIAVFQDDTCIEVHPLFFNDSETPQAFSFTTIVEPNTTSSITFSGRAGVERGSWHINRGSGNNSWWSNGYEYPYGGLLANHKFIIIEMDV